MNIIIITKLVIVDMCIIMNRRTAAVAVVTSTTMSRKDVAAGMSIITSRKDAAAVTSITMNRKRKSMR